MPFSAAALHAAPPDFTVCSRCDVKANPYESRRPHCCCDESAALRQRQREAAASWCGETTENKQAHSHGALSATWLTERAGVEALQPERPGCEFHTETFISRHNHGWFSTFSCFIGIPCDKTQSITWIWRKITGGPNRLIVINWLFKSNLFKTANLFEF